MGLIAWYPLNGTGESKGLITNKFSIGTSEYGNGGKIGKYYLTSNKMKGTGTISGIENFKQISIAFWFKENKIETTAWQDFMKFYAYYDDGNKQAGGEFRLEQHTSGDKTQVYADWYCSTTSTSYPSSTGAATYSNSPQITDLGWHHTVLMLDFINHKCTSYFDGKLNKTMNINTNAKYITGGLYIGDANIDAGICDLRLYDNLLSIQEIKNLNNCLILHYPLGNGYGNENLLIGAKMDKDYSNKNWSRFGLNNISKSEYINGVKHIVTPSEGQKRNNGEGFAWTDITTSPLEVGETYTFSIDIMGTISSESEGGDLAYMYNSTESAGVYEKIFFKTRFRSSLSATHYNRYSMTFTVPSTAKYKFACQLMLGWGADIYYKNVKLEKGENLNPIWTPNPADALYKTLGYNTTTEYDTSGFGNNGEKKNNPVYTTGSPIGNSCIQLQRANSQYIQLPEIILPDTLTISFWAKVNSFGGWQRFFEFADALQGANGNYRFLFGTYSNTKQLGLHIYSGSDGTTNWFTDSNIRETDTNWHLYSISINKTILNIFYDGKNILNKTITDNFPIHKRQYMYIGKSSYSADAYFDGEMSDFRIYATALTADDIKQLYQTKAKIDKNGNLYGNQFVEIDNERNLLDTDDYWISGAAGNPAGTYTQEKIECSDSSSGTATKITCTAAGQGFFMAGHKVFDKTNLVNGKQYCISLYVKSDNRTSIEFNVECKSVQSRSRFTIGTEYKRINIVYTYSNTTTWNAFTSYGGWKVDENVYIHSIKVTEYNPKSHVKSNSVIETNNFTEINSENETKIYKQDIQTNQIIEI